MSEIGLLAWSYSDLNTGVSFHSGARHYFGSKLLHLFATSMRERDPPFYSLPQFYTFTLCFSSEKPPYSGYSIVM